MELLELTLDKQKLIKERQHLQDEYKDKLKTIDDTLKDIEVRIQLSLDGISFPRIERAERFVRVSGKLPKLDILDTTSQRHRLLQEAMLDLANGCPRLSKEYFGIKNYDGFGDQRSDHTYGYGPKHGSIVFRVSLTNSESIPHGNDLEDCLYYLGNFQKVQQAELKRLHSITA